MINNAGVEATVRMTECTRCGTRMSHNDETTKLTEYVCPTCHRTRIVWKQSYRTTA
jgi:predicted RNA-binding Zn-ribbon protein involved in translation (DUF1610 family)